MKTCPFCRSNLPHTPQRKVVRRPDGSEVLEVECTVAVEGAINSVSVSVAVLDDGRLGRQLMIATPPRRS